MITSEEFETRSAALRAGLRAKLAVRSTSLPQALSRSRRLLPKHVRAAGPVLIEARHKLEHPKIARQVDGAEINKAFTTIEAHLADIDPKERRKDARLRWLAVLIVNIALLVLLMIMLARWQGYS